MSSTAQSKSALKFFKGIRFRLTVVFASLFGLFICAFAYILSVQFIEEVNKDFDSALLNYAVDLASQAELQADVKKLNIPTRDLHKSYPFSLGRTYYALRSRTGEVITQSQAVLPVEFPFESKFLERAEYTHQFFSLEGEDSFRALNMKIELPSGQQLVLQVATPDKLLQEQRNRFLIFNLFTIPILLLISSLTSYAIAGKALRPVRELIGAVNGIATKNLSLRVPEPDTGDEIEELSKTFNTLLNNLEISFKAQENFVANASHQLNTPLSIIKGELDVFESKERSPEDNEKFRKSLREEVERLIELVRNMLLISRVEAGLEKFDFQPIRLDETLLTVTSRLGTKAREKKINLRFNISDRLAASDHVDVTGEKQLLECLFENILDNAIKYAPEDSTVNINLLSMDTELEVWISDQGPGIEEDIWETLSTRRFKRGSKLVPGSGIGLPFALQIAHFHRAQISYEKLQPKGSLIKVHFHK